MVEQTVSGIKRWQYLETTHAEEVTAMHFTRKTQFLRFTDDITVYLEPLPGGGTRLQAHSASRLGQGDLGQNPRNLRELLDKLRVRLETDFLATD